MDNMAKGKVAERLAEQMFKEAGFKVRRAGYENTFKDLANRDRLLQGPAGQYIRHHPDLIVIDKHNNAYFVEVKFRKHGMITQQDLFNFPETHVLLFTKDMIQCQHMRDIHGREKRFRSLCTLKPFSDIPGHIIDKYTAKTRRLLGDETLLGQLIENVAQWAVGKKFHQTHTYGSVKSAF